MPKTPPRAARAAIAATFAVAVALGTSACSFATLDGVAPGDGVNTDSNGVRVLNVVLVGTGAQARLVASVQSPVDDTLVSVSGTPETADGASSSATYKTTAANVQLPANTLVNLDSKNITLRSTATTSSTAEVTFTFQKAGSISVTAPIYSSSNPDYSASPSQG